MRISNKTWQVVSIDVVVDDDDLYTAFKLGALWLFCIFFSFSKNT